MCAAEFRRIHISKYQDESAGGVELEDTGRQWRNEPTIMGGGEGLFRMLVVLIICPSKRFATLSYILKDKIIFMYYWTYRYYCSHCFIA